MRPSPRIRSLESIRTGHVLAIPRAEGHAKENATTRRIRPLVQGLNKQGRRRTGPISKRLGRRLPRSPQDWTSESGAFQGRGFAGHSGYATDAKLQHIRMIESLILRNVI